MVLGVVRAVEALHGIPRGRTSHSLPTESKADITPEEDSIATDVEQTTLPESIDAAGDHNEEKANITPDVRTCPWPVA